MIANITYNKIEILRVYMMIYTSFSGRLFYTLPIKEDNSINDIKIKNFIFYFNSRYIENTSFKDLLNNINIKVMQFYFECDYNTACCYTAHNLDASYLVNDCVKYTGSPEESYDILANKMQQLNLEKSTVIYYTNKVKSIKFRFQKFQNIINNLSHDSNLINYKLINVNSDLFNERCQFMFKKYIFDNKEQVDICFKQYVHTFPQFILFLFAVKYNITQFVLEKFINDDHYLLFNIMDIIHLIHYNNYSFQHIKVNNEINNYFNKLNFN